ncbi:MAG: peptidoglycan endopeptidase [Verrucomicrobiota bacterium JB023]|nr:peptidoglycan endopeptidase [Verrucomicrobiota bacterium JB023]
MKTFLTFWFAIVVFIHADDEPRIELDSEGKALVAEDAPKRVKLLVEAANQLVGKPYKWGGGHGRFEDDGYDCSGAASYVLRKAGLMEGVKTSRGFLQFGRPGQGEWITVWARGGHVFIEVAGLRFDTLGEDWDAGPRWYRKERSTKKFTPRRPAQVPSTQ